MMKRLSKTIVLLFLCLTGFGATSPPQDSPHLARVAVIQYVLDAIVQDSFSADAVFDQVFDSTLGAPAADEQTYNEWLNFYLLQVVDTLSGEEAERLAIWYKRVLCHRIYFRMLQEQLKTVGPEEIRIFPYSTIKDREAFDRGYTVHEDEANDTYVITYPYQGTKKVEYVLFNSSSKIRSMAHVVESTGQVMGEVIFL